MNAKKIVSIGFLANVVEWYDFSIYAFLAVTIGELFFISSNQKVALIKAFFLFTISYLIRPIGAIFWGYFGDRYGRKLALKWCLFVMAVPTILIGILPTYNRIGILATFLLVVFRAVQGFASGGEVPISACYVYEVAPSDKKNFFCSFVPASTVLGVLTGSLTGFLLYHFFSSEAVTSYAWRLPFLFGIVVFLIVLYVRKDIGETPSFESGHSKFSDVVRQFFSTNNPNTKIFLQIAALYAFNQTTFYLLFVWMPSYLSVFLHISKNRSFLSATIGLTLLVIFTLLIGYFAERVRAKKLVLTSMISIITLSYPLFLLLQTQNFATIVMVQAVFALILACMNGVMVNVMGCNFEAKVRCSGIGFGFTLPTAIFGGIMPTLCSYLIYKTGVNLTPVFFLIFVASAMLPIAIKSKIF